MDVIAKTRELGALLQQDERYLKLMEAQKAKIDEADCRISRGGRGIPTEVRNHD